MRKCAHLIGKRKGFVQNESSMIVAINSKSHRQDLARRGCKKYLLLPAEKGR